MSLAPASISDSSAGVASPPAPSSDSSAVMAGSPRPLAGTSLELIDKSRACLLAACRSSDVDDRYRNALLAALRAGAAVVAARNPAPGRSRPRSVWVVLRPLAPSLAEWADFFSAAGKRLQVAERGSAALSVREADDLVRDAEAFLGLVLADLGLPMHESIDRLLTPTRHTRSN